MNRALFMCLAAVIVTGPVAAQSPEIVRFAENFGKDVAYSVNCQVKIAGVLPGIPTDKEPKPKPIQLSGNSTIQYDERILSLEQGRIDRTLRQYRQMEFSRRVNDEAQNNQLRPEVRRVVILRHHQYEVPFCPTGPLTWSEIDLVRTDVFAPALAGLYPTTPVKVGDKWKASMGALQELTDLEKIERADVTCKFEKIHTSKDGRRFALVSFDGQAEGLSEDGNSKHVLGGSFYYDIAANFLAYLTVNGTHQMLNSARTPVGEIKGTFVMARSRTPLAKELTNEAIRGLTLEPTAENMQLLFDHPLMGVRLMHPRNWRVTGGTDKQIGIDENRGNGMLITLASGPTAPTGTKYYDESKAFLLKQQSRILREEKVKVLASGVETFALEAEIAKQPPVVLRYYVVRQGNQTATIAVRMVPASVASSLPEVERIVMSLRLGQRR